MEFLIQLIITASRVITILVIVHVVLSYFMSPYHPIRQMIDRLVAPMLDPIRRIMPRMGMLDFSPFILIILIRVVEVILIQLLRSMV
ncbi:MAG: YggT family protein [Anaerolineales bacterium]|nr:YggT family protein [Anaerolineales bacterium]